MTKLIMISNMYTTTNLSEVYTAADTVAENAFLKVEMVDGTSQLIQITNEQALTLGIELTDPAIYTTTPNEIIHIPSVDICVNQNNFPIKMDVGNRSEVKTKYNYKVIHPEDLNLRPSNVMPPLVSLPRGRPKKRAAEEPIVEKPVTPMKIVKPTRTRSGRITRPPIHMEKDFEKIVTNEDKNPISEHNELCTTEFKPLKTNNGHVNKEEEAPPVIEKKKKKIPSQYRCSICKKAYLGRNRMVQHLKTHPDHGNLSQLNMENCEAWSCLIETAMKAKEGQKGNKFCKEILNLIKNARILVKYFFKPVITTQKSEYYVDTILSSILNVKEGNYRFNENELCKDISIFTFLELLDDSFPEHIIKTKEPPVQLKQEDCHNILSLGDELDCNKKLNGNQNYVGNSNSFQNLEFPKENKNVFGKEPNNHSTVNLHFGSEFMDVIKETDKNVKKEYEHIYNKDLINLNKDVDKNSLRKNDSFEAIMKVIDEKNSTNPKNFNVYNESNEVNNQSIDNIVIDKNVNTDFNNFFDCQKNFIASKNLGSENQFELEKTVENYNQDLLIIENKNEKSMSYDNFIDQNNSEKQGKQVDIFRNTIINILSLGASDENMINLLASDNHKNANSDEKATVESTLIQEEKTLCNEIKHNDFIMLEEDEKGDKNDGKKTDEFGLHKLHLLSEHISDELILPDSGHVSNILDTSTSSDDIMNVDQFVNESFKKLTEADVVLPNTSLSLDLPTMDCFTFHTN